MEFPNRKQLINRRFVIFRSFAVANNSPSTHIISPSTPLSYWHLRWTSTPFLEYTLGGTSKPMVDIYMTLDNVDSILSPYGNSCQFSGEEEQEREKVKGYLNKRKERRMKESSRSDSQSHSLSPPLCPHLLCTLHIPLPLKIKADIPLSGHTQDPSQPFPQKPNVPH